MKQSNLHKPIHICAALVILLGSALYAQGQRAKSAADYFPLRVGNSWTYDLKDDLFEESRIRTTATVKSRKIRPDSTEAIIEWKIKGKKVVQTEIYRRTQKALLRVRSGTGKGDRFTPPLPLLNYPLTAGKTWIWKGKITTSADWKADANARFSVSGPEIIKTPAGTFKTMRVSFTIKTRIMDIISNYWLAPNVGLVQQDDKTFGSNGVGKLVRFKIKI